MIFLLNKNERDKIDKLIMTNEYNDEVANFLNENIINQIKDDEIPNDIKLCKLKQSDYLIDDAWQKIKRPVKINNYELKDEAYLPYQCFLYDDISVDHDDYFLIKNHIGYFSNEYRFLTLQKDQITWMSLIPHEINTMKKAAKNIKGPLFVLGLGLGYLPSLVSLNVPKITIIENDKQVINIFKQYILPYLSEQEKYEIVEMDAFEYIKKLPNDATVFIDLWHDVSDGLMMYLRFKKICKDKPNVIYWIEESLIAAVRHLFINLIEEELYHPNEFNYEESEGAIDDIVNALHRRFLNKKITTYDDVKTILKSESLKQIIAEL